MYIKKGVLKKLEHKLKTLQPGDSKEVRKKQFIQALIEADFEQREAVRQAKKTKNASQSKKWRSEQEEIEKEQEERLTQLRKQRQAELAKKRCEKPTVQEYFTRTFVR